MQRRKLFPVVAVLIVIASCSGYDPIGLERVRQREPVREEPKKTDDEPEVPTPPIDKCVNYRKCPLQ